MRHHRYMTATAVALPLALGAANVQAADIVATLEEAGQFSSLIDAIEQAGLAEKLKGEGPYTVFAPTDEAFDKLPQNVRQELMQDGQGDQLKQVLNHHVVEGKELAAKDVLGQEMQVRTLSDDQLTVDGTGAVVVLVPTGLSVARVGDEVYVRREVGAVARPAVTVTTTEEQAQTGQQDQQGQRKEQARTGQQQAQSGQEQQAQTGQQGQQQAQSGQEQQAQTGQRGERAQTDLQGQQQAQTGQEQAQSGQQGQQQAEDQGRPVAEQKGVLRAAMVVEPDIQADNGVIHAIDQVLVPQKVEQKLAQTEGTQQGQQQGQKTQQKTQ